jgi:hypothetical protein
MASPVREPAWLEWASTLMGGTSRQTCAATFPPDRFYCLLDELPLHLIPRVLFLLRSDEAPVREPLFFNPQCSFVSPGQLPEELSARPELLTRFVLPGTVAWVRDPATNSLLPFWLGKKLEALVRNAQAGKMASAELSAQDRFLLAIAHILTPADCAARRVRQWNELVRKSATAFAKEGYVPLTGLIHPFHIAALRRYYRFMIRRGLIHLGDQQSPRRYVAHNEPVARFFHHQIAAIVSALAQQPVQPSYVYLASYLSGAELKKHTDREQCEFSVTLCLDFSPEPECETPWPIHLDTPLGKVTVAQSIGDGLLYRGTRLPHYRDVLPEGHTSTSIFFHYVAADFKGSLS